MNVLGCDNDDLNGSIDNLPLDSDLEAPSDADGDAMAPAVVRKTDGSDSDTSDNNVEEAENTWKDDAQKHSRWSFSELLHSML